MRVRMSRICKLMILIAAISTTSQAKEVCEYNGRSIDDVECSYKRWHLVEESLNNTYQELLQKLDKIIAYDPHRLANLKSNLISAQQIWVVFRQKDCEAVQEWWNNGKLQGALYADCMKAHAQRRIEELNAFSSHQT